MVDAAPDAAQTLRFPVVRRGFSTDLRLTSPIRGATQRRTLTSLRPMLFPAKRTGSADNIQGAQAPSVRLFERATTQNGDVVPEILGIQDGKGPQQPINEDFEGGSNYRRLSAARKPTARLKRMPVESRISVNDVEIALWEWPGEDPPVFFCHATGFHARCWDQVIARLPGRHIFALDIRGHGRSSKPAPPYEWRKFGTDIAQIAAELGLSRALGVGHSMGGHAVTLAAALRPESFASLLLIDPVIRSRGAYVGPWREAHFVAKRRNRWDSAQEMFDRFQDRPPFAAWDPAVLRDYCNFGLLPDRDGFVLACPPAIESAIYENSPAPSSDIYTEIDTIRIPVRVVRSVKQMDHSDVMGRSPTAPELASGFAHGQDIPTAEYSHFIPMEGPEFTARLVEESTR
jgi:lipase